MADYLIKDTTLKSIADAIRSKTGSQSSMKPAEMASKIESITTSSGENVQPEQTVTPTEDPQIFPTQNSGYTAVRKVTVNPIPSDYIKPSGSYPTTITSNGTYTVTKYETVIVEVPTNIPSGYHDTSGVTATSETVLYPYEFVNKNGETIKGEMVNRGNASMKLDRSKTSYTIEKGYHDGSGEVSIDLESKSATPTKSSQTVYATSGKLMSSFTVNPIPDNYHDTSVVTATKDYVLSGYKFVDKNGNPVDGTMPNIGKVNATIESNGASYIIPEGYHDGSGKVTASITMPTDYNGSITIL